MIEGKRLLVDSNLVRADASLNSVACLTVAKVDEAEARENEKQTGNSLGNQPHDSKTDRGAATVRHSAGESHPSCKCHRSLDDEVRVITAVGPASRVRAGGVAGGTPSKTSSSQRCKTSKPSSAKARRAFLLPLLCQLPSWLCFRGPRAAT